MANHLSRRRFLLHSAGIAGASLGLGATRPAEGVGSVAEIRLGLVGLGDRGRHLLGALLRARENADLPPARIVALADPSPRDLKRALDIVAEAHGSDPSPGARPMEFTDLPGLLDRGDVDAVVIATPVYLHAAQAVASLSSGKHVYCEKPLGLEAQECLRVLRAAQAARQSGLVFQVGLQRRYSPRYRSAIRLVHDGDAGRVHFVRAQWHSTAGSPRDKPWLFRRRTSGDAVLEQACHQFDVFNWLLGSTPTRACGFGGIARPGEGPPGRDVLDHYGAVLEYPGGVQVHMSHLSFAVADRRFAGIHELVFAEEMGIDLANGVAWTCAGEAKQLVAQGASDTQLAVEDFLRCVATGAAPAASVEAGYRATLAAILCRRALDCGRTVAWQEISPAETKS